MIKLLIVEDDTNLSFLIKRKLLKSGDYEIFCAENGKKGLLALSQFKPDIIVTDLEMEEMDGNQMIEQIRSKSNNIPIIVLTGKMEFLKQSGANVYLKKPFDVTQLDLNIRSLLMQKGVGGSVSSYTIGKYIFIPKERTISIGENVQKIPPTTTKILEMLCAEKGKVVDRKVIQGTIWGIPDGDIYVAHNLNVQINKIRQLFKDDPSIEIENLKKTGLILKD